MKKKRLVIILVSVCLVISAGITAFLCIKNNKKELSNADMSVAYKNLAVSMWTKIGIDKPFESQTSYASFCDVPEKADVAQNSDEKMKLKLVTNSMSSLIYMVGCLFDNSNFVLKKDIAKFSTTISGNKTYSFTVYPTADYKKNELSLTVYYEINSTVYYFVCDADYNFKTGVLNSLRFYAKYDISSYIEVQFTSDGKSLVYSTTNSGDSLANAITTDISFFKDYAKEVGKLSSSFSAELQSILLIKERLQGLIEI